MSNNIIFFKSKECFECCKICCFCCCKVNTLPSQLKLEIFANQNSNSERTVTFTTNTITTSTNNNNNKSTVEKTVTSISMKVPILKCDDAIYDSLFLGEYEMSNASSVQITPKLVAVTPKHSNSPNVKCININDIPKIDYNRQ